MIETVNPGGHEGIGKKRRRQRSHNVGANQSKQHLTLAHTRLPLAPSRRRGMLSDPRIGKDLMTLNLRRGSGSAIEQTRRKTRMLSWCSAQSAQSECH